MGKKVIFSQEAIEFIEDNYKTMPSRELHSVICERFGYNIKVEGLRTWMKRNGYERSNENSRYTPEMREFIKCNYKSMPLKELSKLLEYKFNYKVDAHSLSKWLRDNGMRAGNKKESVTGFTDEENEWLYQNATKYSTAQLEKELLSRFGRLHKACTIKYHLRERLGMKRGNGYHYEGRVYEQYPIGTVSKQGGRATLIKIKSNCGDKHGNWMSYGRYVYEKAYGKLPDNLQVIHLNGDADDFSLDNLRAVTQQEHAYLTHNRWHGLGEVTKTGLLINELERIVK